MSILVLITSSGTVSATVTVGDIEFLTNTPEQEYSPIWTADGSQIMYVFQRTIWNDRDSYIINADGSNPYRTYIGEGMTVAYSDLSPNGNDLLMTKTFGHWYDLYKVNIDDGTWTPLAADPSKTEAWGYWSPDGNRITYNQDNEFWIMDSDGSNKYRLGTSYQIGNNDWSPDGSKIVYSASFNGQFDLWMINPEGTNQEQITFTPWNEWYVSFSPNGKYIVYSSDKEGEFDLWLREIDSDYEVRLTYNIGMHDAFLQWSPDGTKITFVGNNPNNDRADIALMTLSFNKPPSADAGGPYVGDEGSTINFDGSGSSDPDENIMSYEWDLDNDGLYDDTIGIIPDVVFDDNGIYTIGLKVTDENNEVDSDTAIVTVNNVAPSIISIENIPVDPVPVGTTILPTATFTDPGTLDTHTAVWGWDGLEEPSSGTVDQNQVTGSHTYSTPGIYTIKLTVADDDGGSDTAVATHYLVVYDSEGGFVTGGAWIDSPEGAYSPESSLTGKANFGFVSKYKKGATTPTGQTEFQFKVADLNFHSGTYDWLVIAGHKAMYKGTGTINGEGNFGFLLSAVDEALTPSTDVDLFRIKIWDMENNDAVVYDNQMSDNDDADPTTGFSCGSIVIHKK